MIYGGLGWLRTQGLGDCGMAVQDRTLRPGTTAEGCSTSTLRVSSFRAAASLMSSSVAARPPSSSPTYTSMHA